MPRTSRRLSEVETVMYNYLEKFFSALMICIIGLLCITAMFVMLGLFVSHFKTVAAIIAFLVVVCAIAACFMDDWNDDEY